MPDIDSNSVCPPVRCSKKQLTHRKADGGETSSEWAKRPGGRNVLGVKRPGGETSKGRNVRGGAKRPGGPKRPGGETSSEGAKRQRGETSCYQKWYLRDSSRLAILPCNLYTSFSQLQFRSKMIESLNAAQRTYVSMLYYVLRKQTGDDFFPDSCCKLLPPFSMFRRRHASLIAAMSVCTRSAVIGWLPVHCDGYQGQPASHNATPSLAAFCITC